LSGLNRVQLIGHLGADPDSRVLPSGSTVTGLRVATSERWKDKQSGETKEHTEWHTVTFFGRLAEVAAEYLKKGSQVYLEGKLRTEKWQDKQGNDRWSTKIIADSMVMLGSKGSGTSESRDGAQRQQAQSSNQSTAQSKPRDDFDDDIPF
jgi:single-strand DNA-binding protein